MKCLQCVLGRGEGLYGAQTNKIHSLCSPKDYSNLSLDAASIHKDLADPENLALLKSIMTKLG